MTDTKPKIDKKLVDDVLDIIKAHPLEVDLKVSKKEFVNVKLTDKKIDVDLRDPEELAHLLRILQSLK